MWYIYMTEYYSAIKKEWTIDIGNTMDTSGHPHAKWNTADPKECSMFSPVSN